MHWQVTQIAARPWQPLEKSRTAIFRQKRRSKEHISRCFFCCTYQGRPSLANAAEGIVNSPGSAVLTPQTTAALNVFPAVPPHIDGKCQLVDREALTLGSKVLVAGPGKRT